MDILSNYYLHRYDAESSQHKVYTASDWAILNQANHTRIKQRLAPILTITELQRACFLLDSFHAVYRAERIQQQSSTAGRRCPDPSAEQLQRMVEHLQLIGISITAAQLLRELRLLAEQLRQTKPPLAPRLDQVNAASVIEPLLEPTFLQKANLIPRHQSPID